MVYANSLFEKEIISMIDGAKVGEIYDFEVDEKNGHLLSIIVFKRSLFFWKKERNIIPWSCVKVIGDETILVDIVGNKTKSQESFLLNFLD